MMGLDESCVKKNVWNVDERTNKTFGPYVSCSTAHHGYKLN